MDIKQVPGSAGADAIQLYYANYINDEADNEFFYYRIKVLSEKGNSHADVEIVIPPDGSLSELKARTIHPDGKIIEFTGKPFQKTLIKGRGIKVLAKTFTMPDVTVGSIIEYKYRIDVRRNIFDNSWTIQHELYTVKESFRMKPYLDALEALRMATRWLRSTRTCRTTLSRCRKAAGYELEVEEHAGI